MIQFTVKNLEKGTTQDTKFFRKLQRAYVKRIYFKAVRRQNSPLFTSILRTAAVLPAKKLGINSSLATQFDLDYDIYASTEEYDFLKSNMLSKAAKDDRFLTGVFKKIENDCLRYLGEIKSQQAKNKYTSRKQLLRAYEIFAQSSQDIARYLWIPLVPEEWIMNEIQNELKKTTPPRVDIRLLMQALVAPTYISHTQQLKIELLRFNKTKARRHAKENAKLLRKISDTYTWLNDHYMHLVYEPKNWVHTELKNLQNSKENYQQLLKEPEKVQKRKNVLIKKYAINKKAQVLIQQASVLPYIRLLRAEVILESAYLKQDMFTKIAKQINFPDVSLLHYFEIIDALKGKKIDYRLVQKRKQGFGLIVDKKRVYTLNLSQAQSLKAQIEATFQKTEEIKGNIAFMGKVKGMVKILYSGKENYKIQKGDILVTSMTTPDFVPAMERAVAIVTDEGGISCHAAIVARELKKPCVIGTKNATKILKDGDRVEVDANKGIVRKL